MRIIEPHTESDLKKYFDLRYEVLRKPWDQPYSSTMDESEDRSVHVLMLDENDEAIACGRLQLNSRIEGQIRSMAVRAEFRGKGFGKQIIDYIEAKAKGLRLNKIILDARENALQFYEHCGYRNTGKSYLLFEVIQHFRMEKSLTL